MPVGSTPADVAAAIGPGLAKAALAARVDGALVDLTRPFEADAQLALVTSRDEAEALELARHDYAHVLAEAVQALWPGTQITFGPSTDDGFYYDVMAPAGREPFSMDDLPAIEEKMREIIRTDKPLHREVWRREDLIARWQDKGETFKAEWAAELPKGDDLTVYWSGEPNEDGAWLDMCRGPHLPSTGKLDPQAFKLMRVAGAYWRGDQNNAQLTSHIRHRLAEQEAARRAPHAAGGSRQARSPQAGPRDGLVPLAGRSAWLGLLASQRLHDLARAGSLHAPRHRRWRLPRDQDAASHRRAPVGEIGPLGQIPREHVRGARRRSQFGR